MQTAQQLNNSIDQRIHGTALPYSNLDGTAEFLDQVFPLAAGSHREAVDYRIYFDHLLVSFADGRCSGLRRSGQLADYSGSKDQPTAIALRSDNLQVEIDIERRGDECPAEQAEVSIEMSMTARLGRQ